MIMVPLDEPLDPEMPIAEGLVYLDENEFDLALLRTDEVRIVYRHRLRTVPESGRSDPLKRKSESPRMNRLIEHTLELGEVAHRLGQDEVPLLVVGRNGPDHIITRSDFTRPAGLAGVSAMIKSWTRSSTRFSALRGRGLGDYHPDHQDRIARFVGRANKRDEGVGWLSYLTMRERFEVVRALRLGPRLTIALGTEDEHVRLTTVRNDIAHGRPVKSGSAAIDALALAQQLLDSLATRPAQPGV